MVEVPDQTDDAFDEPDALDNSEERIQKKVDISSGYSFGDSEDKKEF